MMFFAGHVIAVGAFTSYGQCEDDCHLGHCGENGSGAYECDIKK